MQAPLAAGRELLASGSVFDNIEDVSPSTAHTDTLIATINLSSWWSSKLAHLAPVYCPHRHEPPNPPLLPLFFSVTVQRHQAHAHHDRPDRVSVHLGRTTPPHGQSAQFVSVSIHAHIVKPQLSSTTHSSLQEHKLQGNHSLYQILLKIYRELMIVGLLSLVTLMVSSLSLSSACVHARVLVYMCVVRVCVCYVRVCIKSVRVCALNMSVCVHSACACPCCAVQAHNPSFFLSACRVRLSADRGADFVRVRAHLGVRGRAGLRCL